MAEIEKLAVLQRRWPAGGWSWDRRFECVASTIALALKEEAWGAAEAVFTTVWTERSLTEASSPVRTVAQDTGGVRSDQFLLSRELVDGLLVYGLWWPWGGEGTNISMRIGIKGYVSYDEHEALRLLFRAPEE